MSLQKFPVQDSGVEVEQMMMSHKNISKHFMYMACLKQFICKGHN